MKSLFLKNTELDKIDSNTVSVAYPSGDGDLYTISLTDIKAMSDYKDNSDALNAFVQNFRVDEFATFIVHEGEIKLLDQ